MPLKMQDKKAIITEVSDVAMNSISAAAAEYRGLTVAELTQLRVAAKKASVYLRVVRNTLAKRALENTNFSCMQAQLVGPLVLAFSKEEPSAPAKLFRDFSKANDKLQVKILSIGGRLFKVEELDVLAKLPTREQAIAQLMSVMQAPITKFVRTLAEPHTKLVRTIAAIRSKKEEGR